jgi:hypothetical protein
MEIKQFLHQATANIDPQYFQLPVAGQEDPVYRERVYCYELYHQLRLLWPNDSKYVLSGEVDKSGHPLIRHNGLDNTKPDFLVHAPGNMENNLLVMEVKPVNAQRDGIKKDLQTLTAFARSGYTFAFYLIYGSDDKAFKKLLSSAISFAQKDDGKTIDLAQISLWYHQRANVSAEITSWGGAKMAKLES